MLFAARFWNSTSSSRNDIFHFSLNPSHNSSSFRNLTCYRLLHFFFLFSFDLIFNIPSPHRPHHPPDTLLFIGVGGLLLGVDVEDELCIEWLANHCRSHSHNVSQQCRWRYLMWFSLLCFVTMSFYAPSSHVYVFLNNVISHCYCILVNTQRTVMRWLSAY